MFHIDGNILSVISALNNYNNVTDGNKKNNKNCTNLFNCIQYQDDCFFDDFKPMLGKTKNKNIVDDFKDALTSGGSYWEEDYAKGKKYGQDMSKMVVLSPKEQKKLEEQIARYERYRASLSPEERVKLDKNKEKMLSSSHAIGNGTIENFKKLYNSGNYSVMTKQQLLDILHYTDISDNDVDGKIGSFRQGKVGDCWLLSALKNISTSEENSKIIKDSITQNKDGSYNVKFKGAESYIKKIANVDYLNKFQQTQLFESLKKQFLSKYSEADLMKLNLEELLLNPDYKPKNDAEKYFANALYLSRHNFEYKKLNKEREDFIKEKIELLKNGVTISKEQLENNSFINEKGEKVSYSTGDKDVTLIEMAVEKVVKTVTDGTLDGGSTDMAHLLLLDKKSKRYDQEPTKEQIVELNKLLDEGKISQDEYNKKIYHLPLSDEKKADWINILENTPPEKLTASTIDGSKKDKETYDTNPDGMLMELNSEKFGKRRICKSHVYNISRVDKENKIVYVQNPWEPGIEIPLTYDEFFKCYHSMSVLQD